jgi:hypothetical protein
LQKDRVTADERGKTSLSADLHRAQLITSQKTAVADLT